MLTALHYLPELTYLLETSAICDNPNPVRACRSSTLELVHTDRLAMTTVAADGLGPVEELAFARVLLASVKAGRRGATLRMYRPAPTLAFGARDRFLPGFATAIEAARDHGFTPALRSLGGRAAAYHPGSLVIDHIEPSDSFITNTTARFTGFGEDYVEVLRGLGVDARLGEIPGEYCPGEHSVNVAGRIKAIGTAQRVVSGAWLFSSSVVVEDPDPIRAVLTDVEAALGIDWDPSTGGSISEIHPEVTIESVAEAFAAYYSDANPHTPLSPTAEELAEVAAHADKHRL